MKTKNRILLAVSLIPLIITAISLIFLNDTVPAHFGINGQPDRYGSKFEYFILPLVTLAFYVFWKLFIKFYSSSNTEDVAKANSIIKIMTVFAIVTNSLFAVLQCVFIAVALTAQSNPSTAVDFFPLIVYLFSLAFIIIGNYLPKAKRNSFVGVRTTWTKKNDKNWYVANRNSGIAFIISGVLSIIATAIVGGSISIFIMLGILIVTQTIAYIYSYIKVTKAT